MPIFSRNVNIPSIKVLYLFLGILLANPKKRYLSIDINLSFSYLMLLQFVAVNNEKNQEDFS